VSIPVDWARLPTVKSGSPWTIAAARDYLSLRSEDPWAAYWAHEQTLQRLMKILGFSMPPMRQ